MSHISDPRLDLYFKSLDRRVGDFVLAVEHYNARFLQAAASVARANPDTRNAFVSAVPLYPGEVHAAIQTAGIAGGSELQNFDLYATSDPKCVGGKLPNGDAIEVRYLSEAALANPALMNELRGVVSGFPEGGRQMLVQFESNAVQEVANQLGARIFGPTTDTAHLGTCSGAKAVFRRAGVATPAATTGCKNMVDVAEGVLEQMHGASRLYIKTEDGSSGIGIGILKEEALAELKKTVKENPGQAAELALAALKKMEFDKGVTFKDYARMVESEGAIVEQGVRVKEGAPSLSVQFTVHGDGRIEVRSTHVQILENGKVYVGCIFPAPAEYWPELEQIALRVGRALYEAGYRGDAAIDTVTEETQDGSISLPSVDLNMRPSGVDHTATLLKNLVPGEFRGGNWISKETQKPVFTVSSDNIKQETLKYLSPEDAVDVLARHGLLTHVKIHLAGAIDEFGKMGIMAIGDSPTEAQKNYRRAEVALLLAAGHRQAGIDSLHSKDRGVATWGKAREWLSDRRKPTQANLFDLRESPSEQSDFARVYADRDDGTLTALVVNRYGESSIELRTQDGAVRTLTGPDSPIRCVRIVGDRVVAGLADGGLCMWSAQDGSLLPCGVEGDGAHSVSPEKHQGMVNSVDASEEKLVYTLQSGATVARHMETGKVLWRNDGRGWGHCVKLSPDGQRVFAGDDREIRILDAEGNQERSFRLNVPVRHLAVSPDGRYVAATSGKEMFVYDIKAHRRVAHKTHTWSLGPPAFSKDGRVASVDRDGQIVQFDLKKRRWTKILGFEKQRSYKQKLPIGAPRFLDNGVEVVGSAGDTTAHTYA